MSDIQKTVISLSVATYTGIDFWLNEPIKQIYVWFDYAVEVLKEGDR